MSEEIKNELNNENKTNIDDTANSSDETKNTEEQTQEVDNKIPYDRFKAKVDEANALKEKLAEIEKANEEAERKKLEEQNEYKKLYEQAQEQLAELRTSNLNAKKDALLSKAGYDDGQIEVLRGTINGETDEELAKAVESLKDVIAPKQNYIDPTPMNGEGGKPAKADKEEIGAKAFERIKNKLF